ncbi:SURF6 domain-containing protein [Trichoderma novae-zelandiae]
MADSSLQERLRDHAKAFDGLLSLIPAKMYYGEDTSDQWKKEKQTKQEAAAARRAKLDPDSALNRNAKEIMDERAKNKRKLREMEQDENEPEEAYEPITGVEAEKPHEGLKRKNPETPQKKPKTVGDVEAQGQDEAEGEAQDVEATSKLSKKEEKRASKREKKAEKKADKKSKQESGEAATPAKTPAKTPVKEAAETTSTPASKKQKNKKAAKEAATPSKPQPTPSKSQDVKVKDADKADEIMQDQLDGLDPSLDFSGLQREDDGSAVSAPDSELHSPTFDSTETPNGTEPASTEPTSATTSVSSAAPSEKPKHLKIPADTTALRARLAAKIEALRAARKADGTNGKPIRTRQELIEARRAKEAQRKAHKKELRQLAKEEAQKKREEALASNSPGVMSPNVSLDDAPGGFAFGRVAFADGSQMSHDLGYFLNRGKKKGPSDPKTALLKVQHEKKRIEELDAEKRQDIEEKERWLIARRRAEGEKIHDDETMLKKAVKRKEAAKKKSEKAWKERATGVAQAQHEKQKKREENIKQRRDDKLLRKSGKKKKGGAGAKKKKGGRPGFEGSLGVGGKRK